MPEAEFNITPPYDFSLSMRFAQRCRFEAPDEAGKSRLRRVLLVGNVPVLVEISCNSDTGRAQGMIVWSCPEGGKVSRKDLLRVVKGIISADLDLAPFYKMAGSSKRLNGVVKEFMGLKPILTPSVFESAAWAIMGQQVNLNFANTLKQRIVEKYGRRFSVNGQDHFLFPSPKDLASTTVADLKKLQFSTRKAEYLLDLSDGIVNGRFDLESLADTEYEDAIGKLVSIRGIGVWSANYILMRGAGHLNCLPLGDSGLHRAVKNLYRLKEIPCNEKVERLAKRFAAYRSLYTLYLWYSLMKESNGL